ncbi:hypothetical protein [Paractinoplanes atraurantiacus]|uniref:hypothetical protein n=1 Tax=Paractinoplanes atraurantiacus TaxID=1036182 RepID=UPI001FECD220|nr:hypothetical protein [Actinoplanes atraurantiacus]
MLDLTPLRTSRDYRLVFAGGTVSGFGSFITYVTIPFQVAHLTNDPLMVGLLGVCELVPCWSWRSWAGRWPTIWTAACWSGAASSPWPRSPPYC